MGESNSTPIKNWILAARPKTLTAAVIPILAATALVYYEQGHAQLWISVCCLLSALCIQIATNFINDYIDFDKGADTAERIGPIRVTQRGLIAKSTLKKVTIAILIMSVLFGVPLVIEGGWPIVWIGLLSVFLAYSYTGGPWPLAYLGIGDIFVILFFGLIAVGGVYYLQTGTVTISAFILGLQIGLFAAVLIAINNLRDIEQDKKANKRTLPVRFGVEIAKAEICILIMLPFVLQIFWYDTAGWWVALLPFLTLPLALSLVLSIRRTPPSSQYNQFLARSAALHSCFGLLLAIGLSI